MAAVQYYGTGRRKTSTARVFLRPGTGSVTINQRTFEKFFPTEALRTQIRQPLILTETADKFDIRALVDIDVPAEPLENRRHQQPIAQHVGRIDDEVLPLAKLARAHLVPVDVLEGDQDGPAVIRDS